MKLNAILAAAALAVALTMPAFAQVDALGAPGPIVFEGTTFNLVWSSNPTATYYKQEYVPEGEAVESYEQMFMVDLLTEGATPESAAADMITGLDQRKAADPVVNYDMIANEATGEVIFDFLISDTSTGTVIIEWNAYRYVPVGDGLALFAISRRGYGDDAKDFIGSLKNWRQSSIQALALMELPELSAE